MKKIIVGISGASGALWGIRLLELLKENNETHLVITETAKKVIEYETTYSVSKVESLASYVYNNNDLNASISSGSYPIDGMVILPCSIKSLSGIANSYSENLLIRAADVSIKEKRKLVICVRETPLHLGHLRSMAALAEMGAIICPPIPAFYHNPKCIDDLILQTIGKILDLLKINHDIRMRWNGTKNAEIIGR